MRIARFRAAGLVVVVLALSSPGYSQSVSGLLQKGIYTEETVGDLDAAIKIYEQVVAEAEANRSHVAHAHYRLAMCYEKKGRKQEAVTALQKLVEQFPNETQVVAQARTKLIALGQASSGVVVRLVWAYAAAGGTDLNDLAVSLDGKYLAFTDWDTGDVAVRELATGKNRRVTNKGTQGKLSEYALWPRFSADGAQLAYTWRYGNNKANLSVVGVEGGEPRVVYGNEDHDPVTVGWAPDGKTILATAYPSPNRTQFAIIGVTDGSVRIVKSLDDWRRRVGSISLAPDGRTIAYSRKAESESANHDIFLIDIETGQETQVTTHVAEKSVLAWTPDGQRLLYDMERQGARDAWLVRIVGGKPQGEAELVKKDLGRIKPLGFTRDGTLYYSSSSNGPSLFTATLDLEKGTATATPLAAEKFNILDRIVLGDWSPDGEHLAYFPRVAGGPGIKIVTMKTGETRIINPRVRYLSGRFRWSPDGRSFIFAIQGQQQAIYQIDVASGQATLVVDSVDIGLPMWSHDGRGIFYSKKPSDDAGAVRIVYRDLQTQAERDVLTPGNPNFDGKLRFWFEASPDGHKLALLGKPNDESMVLWLIPVNGGAPRELLKVNTPEISAGPIGWTPDGRFVLFSQFGGDEKQSGLWFISANGGEPRKFAMSGVEARNVSRIAIHPDGKQLALSVLGALKSEVWAMENFLPPLKVAP